MSEAGGPPSPFRLTVGTMMVGVVAAAGLSAMAVQIREAFNYGPDFFTAFAVLAVVVYGAAIGLAMRLSTLAILWQWTLASSVVAGAAWSGSKGVFGLGDLGLRIVAFAGLALVAALVVAPLAYLRAIEGRPGRERDSALLRSVGRISGCAALTIAASVVHFIALNFIS